MSTKIYDAYIANVSDLNQFNEFIKSLKEECLKREREKIVNLVAEKVTDIIDNLIISKQDYKFPGFTCTREDLIKQYFNSSRKTINGSIFNKNNVLEYSEIEELLKKNDFYTPGFLAKEIIDYNISSAEVVDNISFNRYRVKNSICIFPINNKILFMVFGSTLQSILWEMATDDKWNDLREKYGLADYHYQNQTDKPDEISDEEWDRRCEDWNIALPSGVPQKDGIVIQLTNCDDFNTEIFFLNNDKILKHVENKDKRADSYAKSIVMQYNDSKDYSTMMHNLHKLKNGDAEMQKLFTESNHVLLDVLPDITEDLIGSSLLKI